MAAGLRVRGGSPVVSTPVTQQRESRQAPGPCQGAQREDFLLQSLLVLSRPPDQENLAQEFIFSLVSCGTHTHVHVHRQWDEGDFQFYSQEPPTAVGPALPRIQCILILPRGSVGAPLPAQVRKEAPHVLPHPYFQGSGLHLPSGLCWPQEWSGSGEADSGVYFLTNGRLMRRLTLLSSQDLTNHNSWTFFFKYLSRRETCELVMKV